MAFPLREHTDLSEALIRDIVLMMKSAEPGQMAVLVRNGDEARAVRKALSKRGLLGRCPQNCAPLLIRRPEFGKHA